MTDQPTTYHSYKDLLVWQKSIGFCGQVIKCLEGLKTNEKQLLADQLLTAGLAIPTNIANGHASKNKNVYIESLKEALRQAAMVETIMESSSLAGIKLDLNAEELKFLRIMTAKLISSLTSKNKEEKKTEKIKGEV